jgi:cell division protein FtsI/penicillin-binding protein 2
MLGSKRYKFGTQTRRFLAAIWPKLPPLAVFGAVLSGAVMLGYFSLRAMPDLLGRSQAWVTRIEQHGTGEEAGKLFMELVRSSPSGLRFDPSTGRIDLALDCGAAESGLAGTGPRPDPILVRKLCRSDIGRAIQNELTAWNQTLDMLAVRDDANARGVRFKPDADRARPTGTSVPCNDGNPQPLLVPRGCFPNAWNVSASLLNDDALIDAAMPGLPSGEIFGFLARPPHPGFGDWVRINGQAVGRRPVTLSTQIEPLAQPTRIRIDVIGHEPSLQVDQTAAAPARLFCHGGATPEACATLLAGAPRTPHAWRFDVTLPAGKKLRLVLRSRAVAVMPVEIGELKDMEANVRRFGQTTPLRADESVALTRSMHLVCQVFDQEDYEDGGIFRTIRRAPAPAGIGPQQRRFCEPAWRPSVNARPQPPGAVVISTGGTRTALTMMEASSPQDDGDLAKPRRARTIPTPAARELGLLPLVGVGEDDAYSLLGQAVRAVPGGEVRDIDLTIDPDLQRLALTEMTRALDPRGPNAAVLADVPPGARRASVVMIDAGSAFGSDGGFDEATGRILAAATLPQIPSGISTWDILAADAYRPSQSPLAARAWSQNDRHFAPGSTFKAVIALSAVDRAARGDQQIARALGIERGMAGGLKASELAGVFGKAYRFSGESNVLEVPIWDGPDPDLREIRNANRDRLCNIALPMPCTEEGRIGLRGAMAKSSNIWFGRLALLLDEPKIMQPAQGGVARELDRPTERELTIVRVLNRAWSGGRIDLVPGFSQRLGKAPVPGARTYATPILPEAARPDMPRRLSLALNGIGQATQATPLAMASIMGSIATGRVVRPRLTPEALSIPAERGDGVWPGDMLLAENAPSEGGRLDSGQVTELMLGLKSSLHAVVEAGGTAHDAFRSAPYRERLSGKTGTAETGDTKSSTNSVWFVGWVDGVGGNYGNGRRIAFACVMTHMTRRASAGSVCAPLIERILTRLHTAPLRQAEITRAP